MRWRVERLKQKGIDKRTKGSLNEPITVRTFLDTDMVQTGTRLPRGRERHVLRGAAGFLYFDVGRGWLRDPRVFGRKD